MSTKVMVSALLFLPALLSEMTGASPDYPIVSQPAQTDAGPSQTTDLKASRYEIVSIKPSGPREQRSWWSNLPNGFQFRAMALRSIVYSAYDIIMERQVSGMPGWAVTDQYDIDARVDGETAKAWKNLPHREREKLEQPMLRTFLADRCQFEAHEVMKELPVYALVTAKAGLKMKEAPVDEKSSYMMMGGEGYTVTAKATSMEMLANNLAWSVGRIVVNKTGRREEKFNFELKWTPDEQSTMDSNSDTAPPIFTAIEEQLGLKLVPDKAQVKTLVIDHMERPSPD